MIELATALLILLGFAFVPLVLAVVAGSVSGRRHTGRTSPAQDAVRAARVRAEQRRATARP